MGNLSTIKKPSSNSLGIDIIAKFSLILNKAKESILIDLRNRLPEESESLQDIEHSIDALLLALGYELSNILPEEIASSIEQVINSTETFGETIASFSKASDFFKLINNLEDLEQEPPTEIDELGENLLKFSQTLYSLMSSFQDLSNLKKTDFHSTWKKYVDENNLDKELPKRFFDYVVNTFLNHFFEIFEEEIIDLIDGIHESINEVDSEIKNRIKELKGLLTEKKSDYDAYKRKLARKVHQVLEAIKNELDDNFSEEIIKELQKLYKFLQIGKYYKQLYASLQFLKVITKVNTKIAIPKGVPLPDGFIPTTEIEVIHWKALLEFAKNPIGYFSNLYPIKNFEDAKSLFSEIRKVAYAFGYDIPDLSSVKSMLIELIRKLEDWLLYETKDIRNDVKLRAQLVIRALNAVLQAVEAVAIEAKNKIENEIDTIVQSIERQIRYSYQYLLEESEEAKNALEEELKEALDNLPKIEIPLASKVEEELKKLLLPVIREKQNEFEGFIEVLEKDWLILLKEISKQNAICLKGFKTLIIDFSKREMLIENIKSNLKKEFRAQSKGLPNNLDELIDRFIQNPSSVINDTSKFDIATYYKIILEEFESSIELLDPKLLYSLYLDCTRTAIDRLLKESTPTANNFKAIFESQGIEFIKSKMVSFIDSCLQESWESIKKELFETYIKQLIYATKAVVKHKAKALISECVQITKEKLLDAENEAMRFWNTVPEELKSTVENLIDFLLKNELKEIDSWQDGVKLAFELADAFADTKEIYSNLEDKAVEELKRLLENKLPIPKLPKPKELEKYLPDNTFNKEQGFLNIHIWDSRKEDKTKDSYCFIDLYVFIGQESADNPERYGVYFVPSIRGDLNTFFSLGDEHEMSFGLLAGLNNIEEFYKSENKVSDKNLVEELSDGSLSLFLSKEGFQINNNTNSVKVAAQIQIKRTDKAKPLSILRSDYLDLNIKNYPQRFTIAYVDNRLHWRYQAEIEQASIILKLASINGFLAFLVKDDIELNFDLSMIWDAEKGLYFNGSTSLNYSIPVNKKIGEFFEILNMAVQLGVDSSTDYTFKAIVMTSFTIEVSCVKFAVKDLGIGFKVNVLKENGNVGDFKVAPIFIFPSGMALTVDTEGVSGSGIIAYDPKKDSFFGAVHLKVFETIEVKALALLAMKMPDGTDGFSFVGLISVYFTPGITIGMGFSLVALGGAIGLNRAIDNNAVQKGVRSGEIGNVFFVEDLERSMPTMLNNVEAYFPIQNKQFFFGVLARITYSEILSIDFGLLITLPKPFKIMVVGGVHAVIPSKEMPIVKINAYFAGAIDFSEKMLWFDASIVDSRVLFLEVYGDMALRLNWGGKKGFLLSAGGFHPSYKPDSSMNLGGMRRIGMKLDYKVLVLKLEAYFAITSNTVQFGARADLFIGWKSANITGHIAFDCLFQFNPFYFTTTISTGVKAKYKSITLAAVRLDFELSGPSQWNAKGSAKFKIFFITFKVNFNQTWGKKQIDAHQQLISLYSILSDEYYKEENWEVLSSGAKDKNIVFVEEIMKNKELVMQPFDSLAFDQKKVPLSTKIERFGETAKPSDYAKLSIKNVFIGQEKFSQIENLKTDFAPNQYYNLNENEKLNHPSFIKLESGMRLKKNLEEKVVSTVVNTTSSYIVDVDEIKLTNLGYETRDKSGETTIKYTEFQNALSNYQTKLKTTIGDHRYKNKTVIPNRTNNDLVANLKPMDSRNSSSFYNKIHQINKFQQNSYTNMMNDFQQELEFKYAVIFKRDEIAIDKIDDFIKFDSYSHAFDKMRELQNEYPKLKDKFMVQAI